MVGFLMTAGVFAMIYKMMPRVQVRWHDVWLGAVVTAAAVHRRQVPDRPVHRQERRRLGLRRRRLAGGDLRLGLLLGADLPAWAPSSPGSTPAPSARCARSARARRKSAIPICLRAARMRRRRPAAPPVVALAPRPHRGAAAEEDGTGLAQRRHRPGGGGGASLPRAAAAAPALSVARSGEAASLPVHQCDHAAGGSRHREHLLQSSALMITLAVLAIGIPARHCRLARRVKPCSHRVPAG